MTVYGLLFVVHMSEDDSDMANAVESDAALPGDSTIRPEYGSPHGCRKRGVIDLSSSIGSTGAKLIADNLVELHKDYSN